MKAQLFSQIDNEKSELWQMSDAICDNPEIGLHEYKASELLKNYLQRNGFAVTSGVGGFETAFRAEYTVGSGGPNVGLLCEYDALEGIGHGCGHHMQGPAVVGAAAALKKVLSDGKAPCSIIVYGTPAEETLGAKTPMMQAGCFKELDLALMTHGSNGTSVDNKTMAASHFNVEFYGKSSHAAISPEKGRSALDAMLLSFNGIEFLREHVLDDVRMHYCIPEAIKPVNAVHDHARGEYALRSYSREVLDGVIERFFNIIKGAALMTGTTYKIIPGMRADNGLAVDALRDLLMDNARLVDAPNICAPRTKTGSTDFGTVTHYIPGACIRVDCGCAHVAGHSKELAAMGKSEQFHEAIVYSAKIIAATVWDYVTNSELRTKIADEFKAKLTQPVA